MNVEANTAEILEEVDPGIDVSFFNWDNLMPTIVKYGIQIIFALVVFFIGSRIIKSICKNVKKGLEKRHSESGVIQFILSFLKVVMYIILILIIMKCFGIEITSISALVASSGLTLGLALQGSLANFAGGVLILMLKPFEVGDYVKEDTHGNEGFVKKIDLFYTTLRTRDDKFVMVPNGTLANSSIINYRIEDKVRVEVKVGISYHSSIKEARAIALEVMDKEPLRLRTEPMEVVVTELGDSSVNLACHFWVRTNDHWAALYAVTEAVKEAFDENGIVIPYPQITVSYEEKNQ